MKTKIGFFDSGIGGVTVLKECVKLLNKFNYVYYSDSINNPYGDKNKEELINIVDNVVNKLIDMGCYVIVIACNTASSVCVEFLRDKYKDIKFIAIVPAIKMVYDNKLDSCLVMATRGTMDSDKFHELYDKYSNNNYYLLSCSGLANLVEEGNIEKINNYLVENLSCYRDKVSSVVLGCTHYPIIKSNIENVLGDVSFYDGSVGVACQLERIVKDNGFVSDGEYGISFIDSSGSKNKERRFFDILEERL